MAYKVGVLSSAHVGIGGCGGQEEVGLIRVDADEQRGVGHGAALEHGKCVTIDGVRLSPLREHSIHTIAPHRVPPGDVDRLTTHATGAVQVDGKSRVVVYIASLGVMKLSHGPTSYQVPVYADGDLPRTETEWRALRRRYPQMSWCLPLVECNLESGL